MALEEGGKFSLYLDSMFAEFAPIFITLLIIIDPLGLVPLFIGLSAQLKPAEKNKIIIKAALTALFVIAFFILAGNWLLSWLRVSPGAFFVAGGVMLFLVSLDMLFGQPKRSKTSTLEAPDGELVREDRTLVAVFPLAIPMLAGPGTITSILLYTSADSSPRVLIYLFIAAILIIALAALAMKLSNSVLKVLGTTGVSVIERIMGLLLSGLAVQFVFDGLVKLGLANGN